MTVEDGAATSVVGQDAARSRPRRWRDRVAVLAVVLAILTYAGASVVVYDRLTAIGATCGDRSDPTSFVVEGVDTRPYHLSPAVDVRFPARDDPAITIAASWYPAEVGLSPDLILVHGLGGCRHGARDLLAAGMLHRHGMAVLMVDLRDHGDSSHEDGRFAGGTDEYRDVLGAWDWLIGEGVPQPRIGLLGFSLGAATAMIAMGRSSGSRRSGPTAPSARSARRSATSSIEPATRRSSLPAGSSPPGSSAATTSCRTARSRRRRSSGAARSP
jgi:fermentation-respiration switch protein FrsA (DUF1100 family)